MSEQQKALQEAQALVDQLVAEGKLPPAANSPEAKAAADRVRAAAERAKAEGAMSGTTKPAGPEVQGPNVARAIQMLDQLLRALGQVIDRCDAHFMQAPTGRPLTDDEVSMLLKRRHAVTVIRQVRDASEAVLLACGQGPPPFGS